MRISKNIVSPLGEEPGAATLYVVVCVPNTGVVERNVNRTDKAGLTFRDSDFDRIDFHKIPVSWRLIENGEKGHALVLRFS